MIFQSLIQENHSLDQSTEDFEFVHQSPRLVAPYTLTLPPGSFPSRSEAKKILAGAEEFKSIEVNFQNAVSPALEAARLKNGSDAMG